MQSLGLSIRVLSLSLQIQRCVFTCDCEFEALNSVLYDTGRRLRYL